MPKIGRTIALVAFIVLAVSGAGLTPTASAGEGTASLVGAWSFDEPSGMQAADQSGSGNDGTLTNVTRTSSGRFGRALSFDGVGSVVTVPSAPSLQLAAGMTLEAWVRPADAPRVWGDVVYKGNDDYYLTAGSNRGVPAGGGNFGNGGDKNAYGDGPLAPDAWTHLATTYDGSELRLYVNGNLAGSRPQKGTIKSSNGPLEFGGDSMLGQYFRGSIDEVRVYDDALSASQIQRDMATPVTIGDIPPSPQDTQAPTAPSGLAVQSVGPFSVALTWNPSTDNVGVAGYDVLQNGVQARTVTTTSISLGSLVCGTSYSVAVVAFDAAGNRSPQAQMSASTAACTATAPTLVQVDGGSGYYGRFASALPSDASYFPIGTWGSYNTTQANRDLDAAAGLNLYVWLADPCGLGTQVNGDSRFRVIYEQGENRSCVGSATSGWSVGDEVDMCCGPPGFAGGNGYDMLTQRNASLPSDGRMRYTNYGKGVMLWQSDADAARFVNLPFLSVISNDLYWFTDPNERSNPRYRVASSYGDTVERMRMLDAMDGQRKPIWNFVETGWPFTETAAQGGRSITGPEIRAAVFHSLIAGARGIIYFQHSFGGPCLNDHHTLRSNCEGTRAAVTATNALVKSIAPALNGPSLTSGFVASPNVKAIAKWDGSNFYVLAGSDANVASTASFSIPCVGAGATATVLGENRSLTVNATGGFSDAFSDGNAIHVYRVDGGSKCGLS